MIFAARLVFTPTCVRQSLSFDLIFGKRALLPRAQGETAFPRAAWRPSDDLKNKTLRPLLHHPFFRKNKSCPGVLVAAYRRLGQGVSFRDKVMGRGQISGAFRV